MNLRFYVFNVLVEGLVLVFGVTGERLGLALDAVVAHIEKQKYENHGQPVLVFSVATTDNVLEIV